jgi:TolB-like protein/DNA-binding SARP family transcriptional activator/Tfp pilus assembly protein PilF
MLQLKLFGVPAIERAGAVLSGRASQRHRLALLALLSAAPGQRLSRDKLIAYLWPESSEERGRNLLKVSTYVLRTELGEDTLLSAGDELRLNSELVQTDVAEFEAAYERGDHAGAIALYRGPFLDGFFLSDAPEFEHWVDQQRASLASSYRNALEALADGAERAKDIPKAVDWWKQCAAQDPYDSRIALRLMHALEASGNRAAALQHAGVHQRLLQEEFGMESAPEIAALAERLRREPLTEISPARHPDFSSAPNHLPQVASPDALAESPADAFTVPAARRSARTLRWFAAAALLAVLSSAAAVWAVWLRPGDKEQSIVVLPFLNLSGNPDNEYFSDGLTEEMISRLSAVPGLKVISRTSAMHYKGSKKALPQIADELKVDHILEGSVREDAGSVRVTAQLIDARADDHLWTESYDYKVVDRFRVQEDIARNVAGALEVRLGARTRRLLKREGTHDDEAYRLYQRGRFLWNTRTREGHERAIEYYQQAIARDSSFADAYAGLADVYMTAFQLNVLPLSEAEAYSRLNWASERALALDDESASAHVAFATALLFQRNWPGAEREFRRAFALNPGNAMGHSWYGLVLRGMGRSEEALREGRIASELDPFAVVATSNYAWQCYMSRDYDCALRQYHRSLEINPYPNAYRGLALTYAARGKMSEAIATVRKAIEAWPQRTDYVADLAYLQARAGQTAEARATLSLAKQQPWEAYNIARAYVALGETDSAFVWFERSNWRFPHRAARSDPALDPVRSDPRFIQLSHRIDREMGMR